MSYKIIEVHQKYKDNQLIGIAVLWESNEKGWVRASYSTNLPRQGYKFIMPNELISPKLIQEVAGAGMNLPDEKKKVYFPGKRLWEK